MEINLSWDLFVVVFFTVIIAYSFIIGRNQTLKIIIASYIAILTSDGIGNLIERFFIGENPIINVLNFVGSEKSPNWLFHNQTA
jgi:lipoprotein signal peptidase